MRRKDVLKSPRLSELKKRRRNALISKIALVLITAGIIFSAMIFFSRIESMNISEVKVSGNKIVEAELITKTVEENLAGYYLWFFPKSNFIFFPKDKIKEDLSLSFKRLKDISVDFEGRDTLLISVSEREGKYIWCGAELPEGDLKPEDQPCYFMDETGYIFDEAPYFSGDVYFRFFGSESGAYFEPEVFSKLSLFREVLSDLGMKPVSLFAKPDGDIEIFLSSNRLPPNSQKVIFKKDFDFEKTVENLEASMDTDPLKSDFKNTYNTLQYIDLRFGNKVYFKF